MLLLFYQRYTPNANMADNSVGARDKSHESEASWALMFCFDNVSPEKACFVVNLVCFISLWLRVAVFLNVARKDITIAMAHLFTPMARTSNKWPITWQCHRP